MKKALIALSSLMVLALTASAALAEYALTITAISLLSLNALSSYDPGEGRRDQRRLLGPGFRVLERTTQHG